MTTFDQYRSEVMSLDPDMFLGHLCWYTVEENLRIPHATLKQILEDCQLDGHVPNEPEDGDVFRRVSTKAQRKKVETNDPDVFANFMVRDVTRAEGKVFRRIVCEKVDTKGRKLGYEEMVDLQFDIDASSLLVEPMPGACPTALQIAQEIKVEFEAEKGCLNSYALRELIRKTVLSTHATVVRPSGGVYFVMQARAETLAKLELLSERLAKSNTVTSKTQIVTVPFIDSGKQRELLKSAFEDESVGEIDRIVTELTEITKNDQDVTAERYTSLLTRKREIEERVTEYSEMLDQAMDLTQSRLRIFEAKMKVVQMRQVVKEKQKVRR